MADINQLVERYNNDELNRKAEEYISAINEKIKDLDVNEIEYDGKINLIENETISEEIKSKLDSIMEIMHWTKMFIIEEEIEKDVIKDCLLALPERKNFDTEFKVVPESLNNKRTKKFQLSQGIELTIRSDAMEYPDKIVSTVVDGKRVIQIVCDDDDTYDAFA